MHQNFLLERANNELATGSLANYRVILLNALTAFNNSSDEAQIIQHEVIQAANGYASQPFTYTEGSATFNSSSGWMEAPNVIATFSEAANGTGYDYTHVAVWQGRGATSQLLITAINTSTDRLTIPNHGLTNGQRGFVRSSGTLPGGLNTQRYWISVINSNEIELHTNAARTARANITSAGTGTLRLQLADGRLVAAVANSGRINPGQSKSFSVSYQFQ